MTKRDRDKVIRERDEAVARRMGWKRCACGDPECDCWFDPGGEPRLDVPEYSDDLNAVADAVKELTDEQWEKYLLVLSGEDAPGDEWPRCYLNLQTVRRCVGAPADQCAKALYVALGLGAAE